MVKEGAVSVICKGKTWLAQQLSGYFNPATIGNPKIKTTSIFGIFCNLILNPKIINEKI